MISIVIAILTGISLIGIYIYGVATATPAMLAKKAGELAQCNRSLTLQESREKSLRTLLERRDAAIKAAPAQCSRQIQHWVKNPDEIPKKFDPFKQLD